MTYPLSDSFCAKFHIPKPPLPYFTGQQLVVRSHSPPSPTVGSCSLNPNTAYERESKHPLERCLLHPPLPGSDRPHTVLMEITGTIRVGDNQSAQLAAVQVLNVTPTTTHGLLTNQTLVVKLYDPLYFDHDQDDADPFLCVDRARPLPTQLSQSCKERLYQSTMGLILSRYPLTQLGSDLLD